MTNETKPQTRPWTWGLGHHYISLFLSAIFLDHLAPTTLGVGGLGPSLVGAALGGLLSFGLLFLPVAMWGVRERIGLEDVLSATFGVAAARWILGLSLGLANVVWFAVGLSLAADYGARGLIALGMITPSDVADWTLAGLSVKAPVVLVETLGWGLFAAVMGTLLVRVVSAVMFTYPVFLGVGLAFAFFATMPGLGGSAVVAATMPEPGIDARLVALLTMVQLVTGFCAMPGLMGADWGKASDGPNDVRLGGLIGIALASTVLVALSLTIVAQTVGPRPGATAPPTEGPAPSTAEARLGKLLGQRAAPAATLPRATSTEGRFGAALQEGVGGTIGGVLLLVFALGLLGPCVYAPFHSARFLGPVVPRMAPLHIGLVCVALAWPLVAFGCVDRLDLVFRLMGAVFGPVAGVVAAAHVRRRGFREPPVSPAGWSKPASLGWGAGLIVGLLPEAGRLAGATALESLQPATVIAWGVAFGVSFPLMKLGPGRTAPDLTSPH